MTHPKNLNSDSNSVELSVVSPMYNEAESMDSTLTSILATLGDFPHSWEIILINDGSIDDTLQKAREWEAKEDHVRVLTYPENCGRGKALRTGFDHSRGKYVVSIDFDLSYSSDHILKIYEELTRPKQMVDVVLGSAYMEGGKVDGVPHVPLFFSRVGNKFLQFIFPQSFKTTTCILRGYKREVLEALELESDDKEIHLEILSKICATGFRVKEIPAILRGRDKGQSKTRIRKNSITHLIFMVFEKPIILFGITGLLFIGSGLVIGLYIGVLRFFATLNPDRPLIPLLILLLIIGSQLFCFAFLAAQNNLLRKELYRLQKQINRIKGKSK